MISKLAESQAFIGFALNQYMDSNPALVTEKIGYIQSKYNQLGREMVATYVSSHYLVYMAYGIPVHKNDELLIKPHLMPFDKKLSNGKNVRIRDLQKEKDNKFVEVNGFVDSIERIETKEGKGVSLVLKDASGKLSLPFIFTYSDPASYGIIKDTFCNIKVNSY